MHLVHTEILVSAAAVSNKSASVQNKHVLLPSLGPLFADVDLGALNYICRPQIWVCAGGYGCSVITIIGVAAPAWPPIRCSVNRIVRTSQPRCLRSRRRLIGQAGVHRTQTVAAGQHELEWV